MLWIFITLYLIIATSFLVSLIREVLLDQESNLPQQSREKPISNALQLFIIWAFAPLIVIALIAIRRIIGRI